MTCSVIAITGPTCTDKTKLAVSIAAQTGALLLPLDQLHRYEYLIEGTGLDLELLQQAAHYGYQILSPWQVSGPDTYVVWVREVLERFKNACPVILEGGCTSYVVKLLSCANDPVLGWIRIVALDPNPDQISNLRQVENRVSERKVSAVIDEVGVLEAKGFLSEEGLPLLKECENLWIHPEGNDPRLAWAVRIAARVYCPAYLAFKGEISLHVARRRIIENVLEIQSYQNKRIHSVVDKKLIFSPASVPALTEQLIAILSGED